MAQAVGCWLPAEENRARFQARPCGICGGKKVALEKVFLRVLRVSLVGIIPPMPLTDLLLHEVFTERTNRQSLETFQKAMLFRKSGSFGERSKYFQHFLIFRELIFSTN
jgi:hypothetical protein